MAKALLFDLDNTLIDRDRAWREVLDLRCPDLSPALRAEVLRADESGRRPRRDYVRWLERHAPEVIPPGGWRTHAERIAARVRAYPEVAAALPRLQARCLTALVSNGSGPIQREKLARAGLERAFEVVVISGEVGADKPAARPFRRALEALGVSPEEAWFVGDHPVADIGGAAALGMTTVWRRDGPWPEVQPAPDHIVDGIDEIAGLLSS